MSTNYQFRLHGTDTVLGYTDRASLPSAGDLVHLESTRQGGRKVYRVTSIERHYRDNSAGGWSPGTVYVNLVDDVDLR